MHTSLCISNGGYSCVCVSVCVHTSPIPSPELRPPLGAPAPPAVAGPPPSQTPPYSYGPTSPLRHAPILTPRAS